jgi:hypothetical protein
VIDRGMEGVGESRGISEEVLASLREGVVSHELYNDIQERDRHGWHVIDMKKR